MPAASGGWVAKQGIINSLLRRGQNRQNKDFKGFCCQDNSACMPPVGAARSPQESRFLNAIATRHPRFTDYTDGEEFTPLDYSGPSQCRPSTTLCRISSD